MESKNLLHILYGLYFGLKGGVCQIFFSLDIILSFKKLVIYGLPDPPTRILKVVSPEKTDSRVTQTKYLLDGRLSHSVYLYIYTYKSTRLIPPLSKISPNNKIARKIINDLPLKL